MRRYQVVAEGEALLSPSVTRRLIREFVSQPGRHRPPPERLEALTEREREVLALVAQGLSNKEIAERLVISPATAKTHVSRTMMKLRAHDRAQLVVIAYETGLVRPAVDAEPGLHCESHAKCPPRADARGASLATICAATGIDERSRDVPCGSDGGWTEAAIAIAGIALVGSVLIVALWQLLATWRTRMTGARETEYRKLADESLAAQTRTAAALEQVLAELRSLRERGENR